MADWGSLTRVGYFRAGVCWTDGDQQVWYAERKGWSETGDLRLEGVWDERRNKIASEMVIPSSQVRYFTFDPVDRLGS